MFTQKYDDETKQRAIRLYDEALTEAGTTKIGARRKIGAMLDINEATIHNWLHKRDKENREKAQFNDAETCAEMKRLREEVRQLKEANEILRLASAFFAQAELGRKRR